MCSDQCYYDRIFGCSIKQKQTALHNGRYDDERKLFIPDEMR